MSETVPLRMFSEIINGPPSYNLGRGRVEVCPRTKTRRAGRLVAQISPQQRERLEEAIASTDLRPWEFAAELGVDYKIIWRIQQQMAQRGTEGGGRVMPARPAAPATSGIPPILPVVHQPADSFRCEKFSCTLLARACVLRQGKRWHLKTQHSDESRVPAGFEYCASGQCAQGNAVREQLGDQEIEQARAQPSGLSGRTAARARKNAKRPKPAGLPPAELDALDEDLARRARAQEQEKASAEIAAAVESMRAAAAPEPPLPAVRPPPPQASTPAKARGQAEGHGRPRPRGRGSLPAPLRRRARKEAPLNNR